MAVLKNGNVDKDSSDQIKVYVQNVELEEKTKRIKKITVRQGMTGSITIDFDGIANYIFNDEKELLILNRKDDFDSKEFGIMLFADSIDSQGHPTTMVVKYGNARKKTGRIFNYADLDT